MALPVNLTGVKIRHRFDSYETIGFCDPAYGIPDQNVPLIWDATAKVYRPFSSLTTVAAAYGAFAGFSDDYVEPQADDLPRKIHVVRSGIVEVQLNTPAAVTTETLLTPVAVSSVVSNTLFAVSATANQCILKVVKVCGCPTWDKDSCPPAAAAANNTSPTSAVTYPTVRTVWAYYNVGYTSLT